MSGFAKRAASLRPDDIAVLSCSGHGARRPNGAGMRLIPTDVRSVENEDLWFETVDLNTEVIGAFLGPKGQRSRAALMAATMAGARVHVP